MCKGRDLMNAVAARWLDVKCQRLHWMFNIVELWIRQSATVDDSRPLALATVVSWSINTRATVVKPRDCQRLSATDHAIWRNFRFSRHYPLTKCYTTSQCGVRFEVVAHYVNTNHYCDVIVCHNHRCPRLLHCLFRRKSNNTSKLRVTGLCGEISPVTMNSLHKGPVARKMFPFDDVIVMICKERADKMIQFVSYISQSHERGFNSCVSVDQTTYLINTLRPTLCIYFKCVFFNENFLILELNFNEIYLHIKNNEHWFRLWINDNMASPITDSSIVFFKSLFKLAAKLRIPGPLQEETTGEWWIPLTKEQ